MLKSQGSCSVVSLSWPPPPQFTHQCFQEVTKKVDLPSKTLVSCIIHKYFEIISILSPTHDIFYKVYSRNQLMWASIWKKNCRGKEERPKYLNNSEPLLLKYYFYNKPCFSLQQRPAITYTVHKQIIISYCCSPSVLLEEKQVWNASLWQVWKKTVKANHHQIDCKIKTCGRARRKTGRKQKP